MSQKKVKVRAAKHKRVVDTLTGPFERRFLPWMASRLPQWVLPDHLTALGMFAAVLIAVSYALSNYHPAFLWAAFFGYILNWFGDSLDGNLARFRHIERPRYGFFVDHSTDALAETLVFIGMGMSPFMRFDIAAVALAGYLLLSLYAALATVSMGEFKISYAYLGPTEMRMVAMLGTAWVYFNGMPIIQLPFVGLTVLDIIGILVSLLFLGAFLISSAKMAGRLAHIDRTAHHEHKPHE